jgi:outer membrane protein assembly factor BamB
MKKGLKYPYRALYMLAFIPLLISSLILIPSNADLPDMVKRETEIESGSALHVKSEILTQIFLPFISTSQNEVSFADWPQVQNDPQRTGFSPETLGTNFKVVWTHPFQPEKVYPQVQAIIYADKVFVGTEMGNLYALEAATGAQAWVFPVGAPILNSVAAGNGRVFFGAMDGAVYALDVNTGSLAWRTDLSWRLGFSTAPVFAENKVMLGGRNGIFYALSGDNGQVLWQYDVGSPILQTAAWDEGRVFFGAMNMHFYAINTADGSLAWQSEKMPGMALKDYWPVVYQGLVYVRPMGQGGLGVSDRAYVVDPTAQSAILADYSVNPGKYILNMLRFDSRTGGQTPPVIHYHYQTMNGATAPPCVDRDGFLAVPAPYFSGYKTGWGRLDPAACILVDLLTDGTEIGFGNADENMNLTCAGNLILAMHTEEYNAHYTGAFDLDSGKWTQIIHGHTIREMSTNTQGGGGNPASIANGFVYHISYHELIVRTTR